MSDLDNSTLNRALEATAAHLQWDGKVEVLVVGGAAGVVTGLLPPERTTADCDVIKVAPPEAASAVVLAAAQAAEELDISVDWLSQQVQQLDVLPDGWRSRRIEVGRFDNLTIYAAGRLDLLAMKLYANRAQDRADIQTMGIEADDIEFLRQYLRMLTVPSRNANLDQVVAAEKLLDALEQGDDQSQ